MKTEKWGYGIMEVVFLTGARRRRYWYTTVVSGIRIDIDLFKDVNTVL